MIVDDLRIDDRDGACELSARLRSTKLAPDGERVWFRVPDELRPSAPDGSPFLPALLVTCIHIGEPLTIDGPVSARLLAGAERANDLWRSWYPALPDVRVEAEPHELGTSAEAAGCFFTCGVDSWYSALNGVEGGPRAAPVPITTLLYSPTADFFMDRPPEALQRHLRTESAALMREMSERLGCELVVVDSNLRELVEPHVLWGYSHGAILASSGLALGSHLDRVHIAGALKLGNTVPLGSHPELDPLWSTERTEIVHDAADVNRVEKLRFLADKPVALERLKVCISTDAHGNCGRCGKCVRTLIGLRVAEPLAATPKFDAPLSYRRIVELGPRLTLDWAFHRELVSELRRSGGHRRLRAALWCAGMHGRLWHISVRGGIRWRRLRNRVRGAWRRGRGS